MPHSNCPFEEGDRIDHKLFGLGTVRGAPTAMVGPDLHGKAGIRDAGWSVPIRWDDPERTAGAVMHTALRKLASPDSRPFSYWNRRWQPLLQAWLTARRNLEAALSTFRPLPVPDDVARLQREEAQAFEAVQRFWDEERDGKHA